MSAPEEGAEPPRGVGGAEGPTWVLGGSAADPGVSAKRGVSEEETGVCLEERSSRSRGGGSRQADGAVRRCRGRPRMDAEGNRRGKGAWERGRGVRKSMKGEEGAT